MRTWNHQQIAHSYYSWALDLEMTPFWTARSLPIPTALQLPELPFSSTNMLRERKKKLRTLSASENKRATGNLRGRRKLGFEASES